MRVSAKNPLPAVLALAASLGLVACSDEPVTAGPATRAAEAMPISLQVSAPDARAGERVAVAVALDAMPGTSDGIQGALEFDPARLEYVGESPIGDAITIVNAKKADRGSLRFTSFNPAGVSGRVALFVFRAKGAGYVPTLRYVHQAAAAASRVAPIAAVVRGEAAIDRSLAVPADAHRMTLAEWALRVNPSAAPGAPVSLRPGEYRLNLKYGDVDFDGSVGLFDYLGVANAAVGNDNLIVDTDGPAIDVDLVIAGNVFPNNGGGACGTEPGGDRLLDLFDYLAIANEATGTAEDCVGDVIPGRGVLPTIRKQLDSTDVTGPLTLSKDTIYQLNSILRVRNGGVLTIQPGTRIEGNTAATRIPAIFVERGGRINAIGTQNEPIVMTCTAADPKPKGCWGGVFIAGRARINLGDGSLSPDGCPQRGGEGNGPVYGGCNDADNSGTLRYVRIEYAGFQIAPNNELNGLTLAGVGSGTTVEYIQIHGGSDDGIEFFGGSVSTRYLVLTGNDDDAFDVSFGIRGDHQFVIVQSDAGAPTGNDSKAIEADGNEPAPGTNATPRTSPRLFNFTIIGNLSLRTQLAAIHLRRATGLKMYNSLVAGYQTGLDIDDPLTCDPFDTAAPVISHTTFVDVPNLGNDDGSDPTGCNGSTSTTEGEEQFIRNTASNREITGIASILVSPTNTNLPDWRMLLFGGQPIEGNTINPSTIAGSTAVATTYRGAVPPASQAGLIPWYSGWTRPFQTATTP